MNFEIYDKITNEAIDIETHPYFKDYGVSINIDGTIIMYEYGMIVCSADNSVYGVRIKN